MEVIIIPEVLKNWQKRGLIEIIRAFNAID
jgi:hypothetical protein